MTTLEKWSQGAALTGAGSELYFFYIYIFIFLFFLDCSERVQKLLVYILQLAVYTVQWNWICSHGRHGKLISHIVDNIGFL